MRLLVKLVLLLSLSGGGAGAAAQLLPPRGLPGAAPAVADPYAALSFFEGNWTIAGLPAGMRFDETCGWLSDEHRHLVCRSVTDNGGKVEHGLGVFSYRPADGMYIYRSFDPSGEVEVLEGRRSGDSWQFSGTTANGMNGTSARRTRLTITPGGERSFRLTQATAVGNGPWQTQQEVHYVPSVGATTLGWPADR